MRRVRSHAASPRRRNRFSKRGRGGPLGLIGAGAGAVGLLVAIGVAVAAPEASAFASPARAATASHRAAPQGRDGSPACTDSWKSATSGDWNTAANWSTGAVPTSTDNACITKAGTYTVDLVGNGAVGTLTLGGQSGKQTLVVDGNATSSSDLQLYTAAGSAIKANGVFVVDSEAVADAGSAVLSGGAGVTLINDGTFETLDATSASDYIQTDLTNAKTGTVSIQGASTIQNSSTATVNDGSFTVTATGDLAISDSGGLTQAGGTFTNAGTVSLDASTFIQSGGADSGNSVLLADSSTLTDSAMTGTLGFTVTGDGYLSGTIPAGQTITALGGASSGSNVDLTGNVTNHGTFILDSPPNDQSAAIGNVEGSHTFTNAGTFETIGAATSTDYIETTLTNAKTGNVEIDGISNEEYFADATVNDGKFTVASAATLLIFSEDAGGFTQAGGTLVNDGVVTLDDAIFTQSGGAESGNPVVLFDASTFIDSAGAGSFDLYGNVNLSGTIPSGQTVSVLTGGSNYNPNHDPSQAVLTSDVTNNGKFVLDSLSSSIAADLGEQDSYVDYAFFNNGTFEAMGAQGTAGSQDQIDVPLVNEASGKATIAVPTIPGSAEAPITNYGTFTVTAKGLLSMVGSCGPCSGSTPPPNQTAFTNAGTLDNEGVISLGLAVFTNTSTGIYEITVNGVKDPSLLTGGSGDNTGYFQLDGTLKIVTVAAPTGNVAIISGSSLGPVSVLPDPIGGTVSTFATVDSGSQSYTVTYTATGITAALS